MQITLFWIKIRRCSRRIRGDCRKENRRRDGQETSGFQHKEEFLTIRIALKCSRLLLEIMNSWSLGAFK